MMAIQAEQVEVNINNFQLANISLSIPKERITAIIGPNGSGKSTLLKVLARLLSKDKGVIHIQGKEVKQYKAKEFAQTLAMLPQAANTLPNLTVRELISYGRSPHKGFLDRLTSHDQEMIDWALEVTGTKRHEQRMFHSLSGGEQQRVRIAMALAQDTDILLLDEPTTYLDIAHQLDLMEMLQEINQAYKLTIVMVLHDLQQAITYCDYLIAMKNGKVVITGSPETTLTTEFLKEVYNIEAKIKFEDNYPFIIPIKNKRRN